MTRSTSRSFEDNFDIAAIFNERIFGDTASGACLALVQEAYEEPFAKFFRVKETLEKAQPKAEPKETEWLMMVDLTTSKLAYLSPAEARMAELKKLVEKSKTSDATILVQMVESEGKDGKIKVARFVIRNGSVEKLETIDSKGFAANLEGLMNLGSKMFKSAKMGLIMESHGDGNAGLLGDTGSMTMAEVQEALRKGLKGSEKEKLDFLYLESCMMAQNGVMRTLSKVADHVVASQDLVPGVDVPIGKAIEKLLGNPKLTGVDMARTLIDLVKDRGEKQELTSLAHFDLNMYAQFANSLDQLGTELLERMKDPAQRKAIESIIAKLEEPSRHENPRPYGISRRDIKEFASKLLEAVSKGDIKDPDGKLKKAATDVLKNQIKLVRNFFGKKGYDELGGLNEFLPSRDEMSTEDEAINATPAGAISAVTDPNSRKYRGEPEKNRQLKGRMEVLLDELAEMAAKNKALADSKELKEVKEAFEALTEASPSKKEEYAKVVARLKEAADRLRKEPTIAKIEDEVRARESKKIARVIKEQFIDPDGPWGQFRKLLTGR